MPEATTNQTKNVSVGKGVKGGYFFSAPVGSTLPTDYKGELDPAFVFLGYISEDGIKNAIEDDSEEIPDMNGDAVGSLSSSRKETYVVTLLETKAATLREVHGQKNVTDEGGVIKAIHTSDERDHRAYVADLVLSGNRRQRVVIGDGAVTEVGEVTYASSEAIGREVTITAYMCEEIGGTSVDYIQSTETDAS